MTALVWLIPAALGLGLIGLVAFLWALRDKQFEDLEGAAWRALEDEGPDAGPDCGDGPNSEVADGTANVDRPMKPPV